MTTKKNIKTILLIPLALIVAGSIPLGFSESIKDQMEKGLEINHLQCSNPNHVLVLRTNGNPACVTEKTAEKTGWEIVEQKITGEITETLSSSSSSIKTDEPTNPTTLYDDTITVPIKSDKEFIPKDKPFGIYSEMAATRRAPSPSTFEQNSLDKVVEFDEQGRILQQKTFEQNSFSTAASITGSNISSNRTFVINQWVPTQIPNGYELKVITWSGPIDIHGFVSERLSFVYAPVDVLLTSRNYTTSVHDSQGFVVGGYYYVTSPESLDQIIAYEDKLLSYGFWERDTILGKRAVVAELTDDTRSAIKILEPDYEFGASSYYHTIDELKPILESIPVLQ